MSDNGTKVPKEDSFIQGKTMKTLHYAAMRRWAMACLAMLMAIGMAEGARKKVYITYILHGNMNYDRYVRPTIWKEFPVIYDNLLDFMDQHPDRILRHGIVTSVFTGLVPPTLRNSPSCMTRSSFACISIGSSPTSSRNMMPLSAASK